MVCISNTKVPVPAVVGLKAKRKIPGELGAATEFLMPWSPTIKLTVILASVNALKFSPKIVKCAANFEILPTTKGLNSTNNSEFSV